MNTGTRAGEKPSFILLLRGKKISLIGFSNGTPLLKSMSFKMSFMILRTFWRID